MVQIEDLTKVFGEKIALDRVGFRLEPGEVVGFVGPNGAGKSTCLRCLVGLVFPDGGEVRVLGMDPDRSALDIRRQACYLPGETSVYRNMTGHEFLDFAVDAYLRRQEDLQEWMLEQFGLPMNQKVRSYSAGMKQKLALMATLVPDVPLYVLDEPDRALDATSRFFLRELLLRLRDRGKTILLSSHHLAEVESVAHRLVFLVAGRIVPEERVLEARRELRQHLRICLRDGTALPPGAEELSREPDGTILMRTSADPLRWLQSLNPDDVLSAEVGITRLEDLYRALTADPNDPPATKEVS